MDSRLGCLGIVLVLVTAVTFAQGIFVAVNGPAPAEKPSAAASAPPPPKLVDPKQSAAPPETERAAPIAPPAISSDRFANMDELTNFAILIGRGAGCGIDVSQEAARVGEWIDRTSPPGTPDNQTMLQVFMSGSQAQAQQQASGQGPDSCEAVARAIRGHQWP